MAMSSDLMHGDLSPPSATLRRMHKVFLQLLHFTQAMDQPVGRRTAPNLETDLALRVRLIAEEFGELLGALGVASEREIHTWLAQIERWLAVRRPGSGNLADTLDALCDLPYVIIGSAVTWGLPFPQAWEEVHQVNMTKTSGPVRPDGKRLKPPGFQPPDIEHVLQLAQISTDRLRTATLVGTAADRCQIELAERAMLEDHERQALYGPLEVGTPVRRLLFHPALLTRRKWIQTTRQWLIRRDVSGQLEATIKDLPGSVWQPLDWDLEFLEQLGALIDPIIDEIPRMAAAYSVCREPQHQTPSGVSCPNGHGGAPALEGPTP